MWTHWGLNWLFLPNPIYVICLNFQQQNPLKNQYLSHLSSENFEINSIKSDSSEGLLTTPRTTPNSNTVFSFDFISFHWENDSIINSFLHTVARNSLKTSQCTPTHQKLFFEDTRAQHEAPWFGRSHLSTTKQNKVPCFIHRLESQSERLQQRVSKIKIWSHTFCDRPMPKDGSSLFVFGTPNCP